MNGTTTRAALYGSALLVVVLLAGLLWVQWAWYRYAAAGRTGGPEPRWPGLTWVATVTNVLVVVLSVATVVATVIAGDAGARAVWTPVVGG